MDLNIRDAFTPDELAEYVLSHRTEDMDALKMAWELAGMAGLEFDMDNGESVVKALEDLPGWCILATAGVVKRQAKRDEIVFFNDSDLGLALARPKVWDAVIAELRDCNLSLWYGNREFLWVS